MIYNGEADNNVCVCVMIAKLCALIPTFMTEDVVQKINLEFAMWAVSEKSITVCCIILKHCLGMIVMITCHLKATIWKWSYSTPVRLSRYYDCNFHWLWLLLRFIFILFRLTPHIVTDTLERLFLSKNKHCMLSRGGNCPFSSWYLYVILIRLFVKQCWCAQVNHL